MSGGKCPVTAMRCPTSDELQLLLLLLLLLLIAKRLGLGCGTGQQLDEYSLHTSCRDWSSPRDDRRVAALSPCCLSSSVDVADAGLRVRA